jgi:hypothetical protein
LPKLQNVKQFIQEELENQDIVFTSSEHKTNSAFYDNTGPYINNSNQTSAIKGSFEREHSRA